MKTRLVLLVGEWSRDTTTPKELAQMRRIMSMWYDYGVSGCFVTHRLTEKPSPLSLPVYRHGTFRIRVEVPTTSGWPNRRILVRRAIEFVNWFFHDTVCRAPKLSFDKNKSRVL